MSYSPLFDRTPCTAHYSCAQIPLEILRSLVVWDRDIMAYYRYVEMVYFSRVVCVMLLYEPSPASHIRVLIFRI